MVVLELFPALCLASYQALHAHAEGARLCFIYHGSNYQQRCDKVSAMELYESRCYFTEWKTDVLSLRLSRSRNESMSELEKYGIFFCR